MSQYSSSRRNPSRETCEGIIKRILMTEVLENGQNRHFKTSTDFMAYFESLYPASDALTKQVQRAIKALNMPKDELGYYIVNKTIAQLEQDKEIRHLFEIGQVQPFEMGAVECVFLETHNGVNDYLIRTMESSETFSGKYITMVATNNGILIYTQQKNQLMILLNSLTIQPV